MAAQYSLDPPVSEKERRRDFIHLRLADNLSAQNPGKLPFELWSMVAAHLIRPCAIVAAEKWLPRQEPVNYSINLSRALYKRHVTIDGIRYIASLSNAPELRFDREWCCYLRSAKTTRRIEALYIGEDHLGIRKLLFSGPDATKFGPPAFLNQVETGLWWRTILLSNEAGLEGGPEVLVRSDVGNHIHPRIICRPPWRIADKCLGPKAARPSRQSGLPLPAGCPLASASVEHENLESDRTWGRRGWFVHHPGGCPVRPGSIQRPSSYGLLGLFFLFRNPNAASAPRRGKPCIL